MKFMFGLQHPLTCKPWTTLSNPCNKVRGEYLSKEVFLRPPSCVFIMRRLFMRLSLILCRCDAEWWCRWLYNISYCSKRTNYNWYNCHLHVPQFLLFYDYDYYYYYFFTLFRVFHASICWWLSIGVRASLFKSPGLFLVFRPISTMLLFGWFPLIPLFPSLQVHVPILCWLNECTNNHWYHRHFHVLEFF